MAQRVGRAIALLFHDRGTRSTAARPGRTLPPGKTRYPFYRRLSGPQGRSGRAENLVPTGIRSQTVQPVGQSLYRLSNPAFFLRIKTKIRDCNVCSHVFNILALFRHLPKRPQTGAVVLLVIDVALSSSSANSLAAVCRPSLFNK